jgi:acyl-CoA reductase-like NAD-dependent aldehyde dehydrogenase
MERLEVLKTYKIYIGGKFPRTESGRFYPLKNKKGEALANMCLSSRKDFRNAVVVARGAFGGWSNRAAFNRSQILYRIGEMLEARRSQFMEELVKQGSTAKAAERELDTCVDRLIYYAGWCDKYQAVFSSVNPVSSAHFNFSAYEPMGVLAIVAPEESGLLGLISTIAPIIAGGNVCIVLASETKPLCAITLAEVLNSSDVPGGVVNILTGKRSELLPHMGTHMDVNGIVYTGDDAAEIKQLQIDGTENLKRIIFNKTATDASGNGQGPYGIIDAMEVKTTWHPIERIGPAGSGY